MAEKYEQSEVETGTDEKQIGLRSSLDVEVKEGLRTVDAGLSADQVLAQMEEKESGRILRKIDMRLVPLLSLLYL